MKCSFLHPKTKVYVYIGMLLFRFFNGLSWSMTSENLYCFVLVEIEKYETNVVNGILGAWWFFLGWTKFFALNGGLGLKVEGCTNCIHAHCVDWFVRGSDIYLLDMPHVYMLAQIYKCLKLVWYQALYLSLFFMLREFCGCLCFIFWEQDWSEFGYYFLSELVHKINLLFPFSFLLWEDDETQGL